MIALDIGREELGYNKCVESIRNMTFLVSQLESELESVSRERKSITPTDAPRPDQDVADQN
jgi:hypothetical protein